MASQEPVEVTQEELEHAQKLWVNFGIASKWGIIITVLILIGMGIFLL